MNRFSAFAAFTRARLTRLVAFGLIALLVLSSPARAQSMLRDAETERFLHEVSRPIIEAAGLDPRSIEFYLVGDPSINAFVTGGQNLFIPLALSPKATSCMNRSCRSRAVKTDNLFIRGEWQAVRLPSIEQALRRGGTEPETTPA